MGAVVTAELPSIRGCDVLTRTKAFVVPEGLVATLEHTLRDRGGRPLDLRTIEGFSTPGPDSVTDTLDDDGAVFLRVKELSAYEDPSCNPVVEVIGEVVSAPDGVVRADVPPAVRSRSGVYQLSWGVQDAAGDLVAVNGGVLSVERSLFGTRPPCGADGPPTIDEIRLATMDTVPDNLWFGNLEFTDDQIVSAIVRPVRQYNELPPRLPRLNTRTFPWKEAWTKAVVGYLCQAAAHNYRRTALPYSAGGVSVNDRDKEAQYLKQAEVLLAEWKEFILLKRLEISTRMCVGSLGSAYG